MVKSALILLQHIMKYRAFLLASWAQIIYNTLKYIYLLVLARHLLYLSHASVLRIKRENFKSPKELNMNKHNMIAICATLISTTALAQDSAIITFDELDTNKDDGLSAAEAGALPEISTQCP